MIGIVRNLILSLATKIWKVQKFKLISSDYNSSGFDSICDGGNVVFNESNPNYFHSLLVQNHWMCNTVRIISLYLSKIKIG